MKSEKWETKTGRSLISVFIFASILLFAGSYFYLKNEKAIWSNHALKQLKTTSVLKSSQVEAWRQERLGDVREIAQSPFLQDAVLNWKDHRDNKVLEGEIQLRLQVVIRNNPNCINILITDTTGQVLLAGKTGDIEFVDKSNSKLIREVIKTKTEIIGDLYKREKDGAIFIDIACPIVNNIREVHAIILFRIDPRVQFYSIVKAGTTDSSEETFLFEKAGDSVLYLTNLKSLPNAALSLKFPLTNNENPAVRAVKNGTGFYEGIGYHNQKVLEYIQPVKNSPWLLASKIDSDELYKPVYLRIKVISIILILLFLSFSAVVFWIINYRRKHFFRQLLEDERQQAALKSHYEYVVKYANDIILLEDKNLNIIEANQRAQQAYQYTLEELRKMKKTDLIVPEFKQSAETRLKHLTEDDGHIFESIHQRKDGSHFNVEISARIINVDGQNFLHQVIRDITERKQAEIDLRESEERFRTTLYSTGDAIITTDIHGHIRNMNPVAEELTGWTETDANGKPIREIFCVYSEDTREEIENPVDKVLEKGMIVMLSNHTFLKSKNGNEIPIGDSGAPIRDAEGKITGVVLVFRDQTKEMQAKKAVEESELHFHSLANYAPVGIFRTNPEGITTYVNPKWREISGLSAEKVLGDGWLSAVHPEDREKLVAGWELANQSKSVSVSEYRFLQPDGTIVYVLGQAVPEINLENQLTGYIGTITDITERKQAEAEQFRLLNIIESSLNEIYVFDANTLKFEFANNGALTNLGFSLEEMKSLTPIDIKPEFTDETFRQVLEPLTTGLKEKLILEAIHRRKNGSSYPVEIHLQLHKAENKSTFFAVINDITERTEGNRILHESHERWENLFNNSPDAIAVYQAVDDGDDFVFTDFNLQAQKTDNLSRDEVVGKRITELFPSANELGLLGVFRNVWRTGETEYRNSTFYKDNRIEGWRENIIYKLNTGEIVAIYNDISDRMKAQIALRESEERFKNIFNISPDAVSISEIQTGRYLDVNESFEKLSGFKHDEIIGRSSVELGFWLDKKDREQFLNSLKFQGFVDNSEVAFRAKEGRVIRTLISARIVEFADQSYLLSVTKDITERINAEIELRQSELKFKSLFENAADPILLVDFNGNILDVNPATCSILGYSANELRNMKTIDLNTEEYKPKVKDRFEMLDREGDLYFETAHYTKNGALYQFEIHSKIIEIEGERTILSVYRDITIRKKAEDALHASEENFRNYFENSPLGKSITGIDGSLKVNQAFCRMLGYTKEELLQINWREITHPDDLQLSENAIKSLINGEQEIIWFEKRYIRKDRDIVWTEVSSKLQKDAEDKPSYFISTIQDITERKQAQKQLKLLGRAIEQNPVTIVITNTDGDIEYVNPQFAEVTGYTSDEVIGKNPRFLQSGEHSQAFYKDLWNTILSGGDWHGEMHNKKKNGEDYWESAVISPVLDENGKISSFVAVKEDITERKKIIQDLIVAKEHAQESDRLKSAFLATMSHELRTPLNAVIGFSSLIDEETPITQITSFAKMIHSNGNSLLDIIEGILDLTLLESGETKTHFERFSIAPFMKTLLKLAKEEQEKANKPQLQVQCINFNSEKQIQLYSDPQIITKIYSQLLRNAFKFTSLGKVEIGYLIESEGGTSRIKFFVNDTGIGIPENQKSLIFERFRQVDDSHTRKYGGTGIGLTIAKHKVELLGGQIWADSMPGKGTSFYFTIPMVESELIHNSAPEQEDDKKMQTNFSTQTILIAEDEDSNFDLLKYFLVKSNLNIIRACDGQEAVDLCSAHPEIGLVLMDIKMPKMNGFEATKMIKIANPKLPVVAVTAFAMPDDKEKSLLEGCDEYMEKPIKKERLFTLLQKFMS
ncbi:MAG: hypothetical protein ACD_77C00487G0021 [uncultured bacterium]|nr:MAG: hypothetical protein ACD_77C00487G0021 [uncultured bacterium]